MLKGGTGFVARCLKVVAVAGLRGISWCVLGGTDFISFFFRLCLSSNASLVVMRPFSFPLSKKPSAYRGAYMVPFLFYSMSVCVTFVVSIDFESCTSPTYTNPGFMETGIYGNGRVWANAWDVFPRMLSQVGRGRRSAADFVVCFGWGGFFFRVFFFVYLFV